MRHVVAVGGVLLGLLFASSAGAQTFERVWVDVNFGIAVAAEDNFSIDVRTELFEEDADFGAHYSLRRGASFDVGGGVMFTPLVGAGVSFSGTAHEDVAMLSVRIPHPFFFSAFGSDTAPTDLVLQRVEGGVNIHAMFVPVQTDRVRFRVFGGPTYFRVEQDAIRDIEFDQRFGLFTPTNTIDITGFEFERVEADAWGYHAGADVSFFFTRIFGVGGFAKFSRGTVDLDNPLAATLDQDEIRSVRAGGFQVGGGVRLKF